MNVFNCGAEVVQGQILVLVDGAILHGLSSMCAYTFINNCLATSAVLLEAAWMDAWMDGWMDDSFSSIF